MKHLTVEQVANGFVVTLHVIPEDLTAMPHQPWRLIVPADKIMAVLDAFLCEGGTISNASEIVGA